MPPRKSIPTPNSAAPHHALGELWTSYRDTTSNRLKTVDAFLVFIMFTGVFQFLYFVLVTNFPFNAFVSGFGAAVGQFVLTAALRSQVNPANKAQYKEVSPERAFADFAFGSIVLHFFVFNFLG